MRITSAALAAALATAVTAAGAAPAAAQGPPVARLAWIKSCPDRDAVEQACGRWRLVLSDGRTLTVKDSATNRIGGDGAKALFESALTLSADGRWLAYERAGDHRLVVRRVGGAAKVLPASLVPKRTGTDPVELRLSPRGERLVVAFPDADPPVPARIVDLRGGGITKLPVEDEVEALSGDGDEVLVRRHLPDNTTKLVARRLDGTGLERTPPQVVMGATVLALARDGRTVAAFVPGHEDRRKPPGLRLYDLATGELSAARPLPLKPADGPDRARWLDDDRLAIYQVHASDRGSTVIRVLTVDAATGATRPSWRVRVPEDSYSYTIAGE
ncbi:hypothetical protein [Nonomuraea sp. NPDC050310]|uniref:hypothetical protein n=1 Tax=Nonomuraea sp. NPDC050310 TaxID=3154935 RepID=UPI0033E1C29F